MAITQNVAKYIISSIPVDNLKLQKLMFYSQAVSLVQFGKVLFSDEIQAWPYGPVVPAIYHEYKTNGFSIITAELDSDFILDIEEMKSVDLVLGYYGDMSGTQLINETHSEAPWIDAYKKGSGSVIETDVIKDFYKDVLVFDD
jgi:uncharacterized phage-associated protein